MVKTASLIERPDKQPSAWQHVRLGDIATVAAGGTPSRSVAAYWNGNVPWVTTSEIDFNTITSAAQSITELGLQNSAAKVLQPGTLVMALYGQGKTRGKVGLLGIQAATNQACASITLSHGTDPLYVFYSLAYRYEFIRSLSNTGNQDNLNGGLVRSISIPLPPLHEQQAIAHALSEIDESIQSLEQLIAKKRDLKQAAMQQLLTGQTRLPGFSGEWQSQLLGEVIAHCSSGATPYRGRKDYYQGRVKWITSGELNYNVITDTIEHISEQAKDETRLTLHPAGTFLMAITGLEAAGTRGACGIVGAPATTNQSCMAIYPSDALLPQYLFHFYRFRGDALALRFCQGTKQQSYTAALIRRLPIELPPTTREQAAIAEVLSDMDAEITALEARLAKTRDIKQGMMQELMTGRTRLV